MKKFLYLATVLCAGLTIVSCSKDEDEPTVQQPETPVATTATVDFEGQYWNALIPEGQAYGEATLIYGEAALNYAWKDEKTGLSSKLTLAYGGSAGFAEGGIVISNYIDANLTEHASPNYQLAVPATNGSNNFAVGYCEASVFFPENVKHVIKSMQIGPTTYELGAIDNGINAASLKESGFLTLIITADNGNKAEIELAKDGTLWRAWQTVDLSRLGAVNKLTFTMVGSDKTSYDGGQTYYLNSPAYFAFDNVVVEL